MSVANFGGKRVERETPGWLVDAKQRWAEQRAEQRQAKKEGTSYAQQDAENDHARALEAEHKKKRAHARLLSAQKESAEVARATLVNEQARRLLQSCLEGEQIPKEVPKNVYARFRALRQRERLDGHNVPPTCYAARELPRKEASLDPLPNDGVRRCEHVLGRKYCGSIYCALMADGTPRCERHDESGQREKALARAEKKLKKEENFARHQADARKRKEWRLNNPHLPYPGQEAGDEEDEEDEEYEEEEGDEGEGDRSSEDSGAGFRMLGPNGDEMAINDDDTARAFAELRKDILPSFFSP